MNKELLLKYSHEEVPPEDVSEYNDFFKKQTRFVINKPVMHGIILIMFTFFYTRLTNAEFKYMAYLGSIYLLCVFFLVLLLLLRRNMLSYFTNPQKNKFYRTLVYFEADKLDSKATFYANDRLEKRRLKWKLFKGSFRQKNYATCIINITNPNFIIIDSDISWIGEDQKEI